MSNAIKCSCAGCYAVEEIEELRREVLTLRESLRRTKASLDVAVHALAVCEALKSERVTKADMTTWTTDEKKGAE